MTFGYVSVEDAIKRGGLRMVVVGGVPSPWGEAAKGILHIKGIEWVAVRLVYDSTGLGAVTVFLAQVFGDVFGKASGVVQTSVHQLQAARPTQALFSTDFVGQTENQSCL